MNSMMKHAVTVLIALTLAGAVQAADAPAGSDPVKAPAAGPVVTPDDASPQVMQWLDKLEARGAKLKSFTADVVFDKENTLLSDREIRMGDVAFAAADEATHTPARFRIDFNQMVVNQALRQHHVQYIFDGQWLVEKNFDRHMFEKRQVVAPGQSFDPLSIDGPFPLPLGQKRAAVLARFHVAMGQDKDDDAKLVHLVLTPREGVANVHGQKRFDQIDLWFDREQLLPVKVIARQSPNKTTVTLRNLKADSLSGDQIQSMFDTTPPAAGSGWNVDIKPWREQESGR